jgi:hypothetical protein
VIWLVPAVLAAVVAVPLYLGVRRVAAEAVELQRSMAALAALRAPMLEVRDEARAVAVRIPELRLRTRPALPPAP